MGRRGLGLAAPFSCGWKCCPGRSLRSPLQLFRRRRRPSQGTWTSSLNNEEKSKTRIKHLLVIDRGLKQPPAELEAREPAAGINLKRLRSRRRVYRSPWSRSRPAGNQPRPVLLRDQGRALATSLVAILVVVWHEAKSAGHAPREGLSRLPVGRLRIGLLFLLLFFLLSA